jgi:glutathione S-transferase
MYTLHIGNKNYSSWSLRPWVLMTTLGIPFEEQLHRFPSGRSSYPEFRNFSPTGLVPVLDDGVTKIWESLGIVEYLAERHPGVWPTDPATRAWARSATAEMHAGFSNLRNICGMNCGIRVRLKAFPDGLKRDLERIQELWSEGRSRFGGPFLAGSAFTAADAFFCPVAFRVQTYGLPLGEENAAYAQRLLDLPAMRQWYEAALKEDFRESGHENEHIEAGEWLADYRAKPAA